MNRVIVEPMLPKLVSISRTKLATVVAARHWRSVLSCNTDWSTAFDFTRYQLRSAKETALGENSRVELAWHFVVFAVVIFGFWAGLARLAANVQGL